MIAPFLQRYKQNKLSFFPIPLGKKEANIKWQVYQKRRPTDEEIKQWGNGNKTNIAVVCGTISENLTILDCDSIDRFYELSEIICQQTGIKDILDFTTISQTGKGIHIWLRTKEPIKSQKFPKLDIKGEGGYIIAPPSIHPSGVGYKFLNEIPIRTVELLTDIGIDIKKPEPESSEGGQPNWISKALQGVPEGMRDDTCARLAGYFLKSNPPDIVKELLYSFASKCEQPSKAENPFTTRDVDRIVDSIKAHHAVYNDTYFNIPPFCEKSYSNQDKIRTKSGQEGVNYAKRFDEFLSEAGGRVDKREVAEVIALKVTSDYFRRLLARRKEEGKVRAFRGSHFLIEWIKRDYMITQLDKVKPEPMLDIAFPLRIHEYASLPPRSMVGIAGMTSSGKTSFLLEMAELNVMSQALPVYYWYNEMSEAKMIYRCEDFPALIQAWKAGKFFPVMQSNFEFADVLQPDAINLVDYIDRDDDVFLIGGDIKKLYAPLDSGVVIFALQKKAHLDLGYGGIPSVKLSNLYIALDIKYQSGQSQHCTAKIVKCKDWKKLDTNPNSLCCEYHTGGKHGKLFLDGEWKLKKD